MVATRGRNATTTAAKSLVRARERRSASFYAGKSLTYAALLLWAFICLFPIYWTAVTSLKNLRLITTGPYFFPWIDFEPVTLGWTVLTEANDREEFLRIFNNSLVVAVFSGAAALVLGSLAGYGLARFDYRFAIWRNRDISFWFVSQLILPPAAVIMPILILYRELHLLDSRLGLVILYTVSNLPIVIWIMRDQFNSIPVELEEAALVDGSTLFGAFLRIVLPVAGPGMVAAFILVVIFCWNEYFFAANLSTVDAVTLPSKIAAEVSSQGAKYWSMAAIATTAIAPLLVVGILLERYIVKGLTAGAVK
jgi:multiple sugar transport system permease protein